MDMDADNQTICLMQACPARKTRYGTNQTHRPAPLPCCPIHTAPGRKQTARPVPGLCTALPHGKSRTEQIRQRPAPLPCCPLQADSPLWTEPDAAVMAFVSNQMYLHLNLIIQQFTKCLRPFFINPVYVRRIPGQITETV